MGWIWVRYAPENFSEDYFWHDIYWPVVSYTLRREELSLPVPGSGSCQHSQNDHTFYYSADSQCVPVSLPPLHHDGSFITLLLRHHRPPSPSQGKVWHRDAGTEARLRQEGTLFDSRSSRRRRKEEGRPKEPKEEGEQVEEAESPSGEDQVGEGSFSTPSPRRTALPSPSPTTGTRLTTRLVWEHSPTRRHRCEQLQPRREQPQSRREQP